MVRIRFGSVALAALVLLSGCHMFGVDVDARLKMKEIVTPKIEEAEIESAERIEIVSRQLLGSTPLGIPNMEVVTVGAKEAELFHRDSQVLYATDGLAAACKTDEQLAAMLAREMGAMTVEFRRAAERQAVRTGAEANTASDRDHYNPNAVAMQLLVQAGYKPQSLQDTNELHKRCAKQSKLAKQLSGAVATPRWSK